MERIRPFIAQLQLAKCQNKALCGADTVVETLSFVRGGFYILDALHRGWLEQELAGSFRQEEGVPIAKLLDSVSTENLPQSILILQNSDWYADFLSLMSQLSAPFSVSASSEPYSANSSNIITSAKSEPSLDAAALERCLLGFEQYFESQLSLSEEY